MIPAAIWQIRFDHGHVLTLFRSYSEDMDPRVKLALVQNISIALEVHAQLEEEIFYPALIKAGVSWDIAGNNVPEHDEMRLLIMDLKMLDPRGKSYDGTVRQLMSQIMHHVADEESTLLPEAERVLGKRLGTIGLRMTARRLELLSSRAGELAGNVAQLAGSPLLLVKQSLSRSFFRR
jgi:hypothetical protein